MASPKKPLTEKQQKFAQEFAKHGIINRAAKAAGYNQKITSKDLNKSKAMTAILEESRAKLVASTGYGAAQAMDEAQRAIEFAITTNNANAYVKAVELRARISGLMIEKVDIRGQLAPLSIQLSGVTRHAIPVISEVQREQSVAIEDKSKHNESSYADEKQEAKLALKADSAFKDVERYIFD